jgi:hypothetical protein
MLPCRTDDPGIAEIEAENRRYAASVGDVVAVAACPLADSDQISAARSVRCAARGLVVAPTGSWQLSGGGEVRSERLSRAVAFFLLRSIS